ncbi:MAG: hypothetical protein ACD_78C00292G0001 [uncultured bacterium (gcode 4)]|uniref:Uncharacterized protein n=1 Tax=uncultured bacterium (gcode 4) TaxID=1234023 RepID=K1YWT1_9BACT|nr:MAG: hypothetical protein ACD_78C00292G0001 [uncultured bacterium (gcode 4)]
MVERRFFRIQFDELASARFEKSRGSHRAPILEEISGDILNLLFAQGYLRHTTRDCIHLIESECKREVCIDKEK